MIDIMKDYNIDVSGCWRILRTMRHTPRRHSQASRPSTDGAFSEPNIEPLSFFMLSRLRLESSSSRTRVGVVVGHPVFSQYETMARKDAETEDERGAERRIEVGQSEHQVQLSPHNPYVHC